MTKIILAIVFFFSFIFGMNFAFAEQKAKECRESPFGVTCYFDGWSCYHGNSDPKGEWLCMSDEFVWTTDCPGCSPPNRPKIQ